MVGSGEWLVDPVVEVRDEEDDTRSALVTLRRSEATQTVQPFEEALVFFHLDTQKRAVSLELLERLSGSAALRVIREFIEKRNGTPLEPAEVASIVRGMSEAQARLEHP